MKVKDVIIRALGYAGRDDVSKELSDGEELSEEASEAVDTLLYCYNAVEDELARFYFSLTVEETLKNHRGIYEFSSFSRRPIKILEVIREGKQTTYEQFPAYISCGAEEITVRYRYAPAKKTLEGDCEFAEDKITAKLLACGAASEYYLINGDMRQAEFYENLYRQEIDAARRVLASSVRFPPRRWV